MEKKIKICIITGASRGLGSLLASRFWHAGYSLVLIARTSADLYKVKSALPVKPEQSCTLLACDLSDPYAVNALSDQIIVDFKNIHVLINNAAIHGPIGNAWENDLIEWNKAIQVNLLAPVALSRAVIPSMAKLGFGSIINISGGGATSPRPFFSAYSVAKAGLVRFSETLAEETRNLGIRVNCIAPGAMKSELLAEVIANGPKVCGLREYELATKVFSEGGASIERVADLALFLASELSNGITGKLVSAVWDRWEDWLMHLDELNKSDVYTLRRISGKDRNMKWGDK